MTYCTERRRDVTIQEVVYEMPNGENKKAVTSREQWYPVAEKMSGIIHCTKGCRNMAIEQDGAIRKRHTRNAAPTSETGKVKQCRKVEVM